MIFGLPGASSLQARLLLSFVDSSQHATGASSRHWFRLVGGVLSAQHSWLCDARNRLFKNS